MKKAILAFLVLLMGASLVWGQATNRQKKEVWFSGTLDATDADTITISNLRNTGKGLFTFVVWVDSLDGSSDSLSIQWRRAWRNVSDVTKDTLFLGALWNTGDGAGSATGDTIIGADIWLYSAYAIDAGSAQGWEDLQIYSGASGTLDEFDNDFDWEHGRRYECWMDFDGKPFRYIQMKLAKTGNDSTTGDADSCKWYLEVDLD